MRLDFNVLWVEDQPDHVAAQISAISRQMLGEGFEFNPIVCHTTQEVADLVADGVFNDEIDLILVDWDLGGGREGQDAIAEIRGHIQFKDVVFYSANNEARDLRQLAFERGLEGVFCARRADLVEEVMGVFESLVKKVLDLDHTRGIVMGATSDIDYMVRDCLAAIHDRLDGSGQQRLARDALDRIAASLTRFQEQLDKLHEGADFLTILEAHAVFTANDGLRLLSRALELQELAECAAYRQHVVSYMNDVMPKRNKLGHRVLNPDGRPIAIQTNDGEQINVEEMRMLRCLLLELRSEFRNLQATLRPPA